MENRANEGTSQAHTKKRTLDKENQPSNFNRIVEFYRYLSSTEIKNTKHKIFRLILTQFTMPAKPFIVPAKLVTDLANTCLVVAYGAPNPPSSVFNISKLCKLTKIQ